MFCLPVCVYVHSMNLGTYRKQKRFLDPLELKLLKAANCQECWDSDPSPMQEASSVLHPFMDLP